MIWAVPKARRNGVLPHAFIQGFAGLTRHDVLVGFVRVALLGIFYEKKRVVGCGAQPLLLVEAPGLLFAMRPAA